MLFSLDNVFFTRKCFYKFRYLFGERNYDIIQVSGQIDLAYKIKKITKSKVVLFFPGLPDLARIDKIKAIDGVFSDGYAFHLLKEIHPRCEIIYGGVKESFCYSETARNLLRKKIAPKNENIILMVNRLVFLKNIGLAINIAVSLKKINNSFKIVIIGDGPEKNKIEKDIRKHKLSKNVILIGGMAHDSIVDYYSASDVFLITSSFDNFPNVVKEAMKMGLPIVASNNSGMAMQIKNGVNGFLCKDCAEFVERLLYLFKNRKVREQISITNKKVAERLFSWQNNYNKYLSFINSL